mgnify:CR=1 FL=1
MSLALTSFERLNLRVSDKAEIKLSAERRLKVKSVVKLLVAILISPFNKYCTRIYVPIQHHYIFYSLFYQGFLNYIP